MREQNFTKHSLGFGKFKWFMRIKNGVGNYKRANKTSKGGIHPAFQKLSNDLNFFFF